MSAGDRVNLVEGETPEDYHCQCDYCTKVIGNLRPTDGGLYSRLERRSYYDKMEQGEGGHVAKTPLHLARWAVQQYTQPGDWVLDPTIGAGTSAVESISQGRNVAGMEIQFGDVLKANIQKNLKPGVRAEIRLGDARGIGKFLEELGQTFQLLITNPPYSADEHVGRGDGVKGSGKWTTKYKEGLPNLAFLKEGQEYWDTMRAIYAACVPHLAPGAHFVIGVKDMMKNKQHYMLHKLLCDTVAGIEGMGFVGTAFLKHYPPTQHLNTYEKKYGIRPPLYQTISVFQRA